MIVNFQAQALVTAVEAIQPGLLSQFMIKYCDKIKFCNAPQRDRKYVICAYSTLVCEFPAILGADLPKFICSILELT